ncbi:RNA polymerase II mediator complex subunit [Malassezia nana]|uniref:Mediator of RNA polymerase II transcription subunit 12 n=1 Tax=Malassezia nana TaxID=180528 RepID=A0AAF0EKX1_9BASI|nr:RNA polymerase II mediator complex subunit [Malassezia nana]
MSDGGGAARAREPYELEPPPWRPALHHSNASLGVPGIRWLRSGTPPSDHALQHGAPLPPVVPSETASMQTHMLDRVLRSPALQLLERLVECVRDKRRRGSQLVAAHTALPPRVTLNEANLAEYVRQLADPHVPLYQLAERIPHGFRGVRLLDMLYHGSLSSTSTARSVPLSRALWLIRMTGALELEAAPVSHKDVQKYTMEWTLRVLHWMSQLVSSLREPTAWVAQWNYATALVDHMLQENLMEPYFLYRWLVTQLEQTRGGVRACVLQWVVLHTPAILGHAALGVALLASLGNLAAEATWLGQQARLHFEACVHEAPSLCTALPPSILVALDVPERWQTQSQLLQAALAPLLDAVPNEWDAGAVFLLDRGASITSLFSDYFLPPHASAALARHRLFLLFHWACTEERRGYHRLFVATALVQLLDECQAQRLALPDGRYLPCPWTPFSLGEAMLQWIESLDEQVHTYRLQVWMAARLLGVLAQKELFSYAALLQRLLARAAVRATSERKTSRHNATVPIRLLRSIPVPNASASLLQQRRFAIYGVRTSESYEEATERRAIRELRRFLEWDEGLPTSASTISSTTTSPLMPPTPLNMPSSPVPPTSMAWAPPHATTQILEAFSLQQRLPHLWSASPHVQTRIIDHFFLPSLLSDVSSIHPDRFAIAAALLTALHAMEALGKVMSALLDGHNLMCVVSICHTIAAHARVWDALDKTSSLADLITPYALAEAPLLPGTTRVVPATGRSMTLAQARRALAALAHFDDSVPTYAPMPQAPLPSALSSAPVATQAVQVLLTPGAAWDDACTALIAAVPLDEAASLLCTQALDLLAEGHLVSDALVTCLASLAGTAGVRLDHVAHTWIRAAWQRSGTVPAWTTLLLSLVRFGYVDGDLLVQQVLCPFLRSASAAHPGWQTCITLLHALVFTYTEPGSPCSMDAVGHACWYDITLLRGSFGLVDGFVPLLHALEVCDAPQSAEWSPLLHKYKQQLRILWLSHPDAVWHGLQVLDQEHRAEAHRAIRAVLARESDTASAAWAVRLDDAFEGALAALDVRVRLEDEPITSQQLHACLPSSTGTVRLPMDLLLRWDLPSTVTIHIVTTLLRAIADEEAPTPSIEALAGLVQAWTGGLLPCDTDVAARAVVALPSLATRVPRNAWLSAVLGVLRCTTTAAAWTDVLDRLIEQIGPLEEAVTVRVQSALQPAVVDTWLSQRAQTPQPAHACTRATRYDRARTCPSPWAELDATLWPEGLHCDPWACPLRDYTGILTDLHAQKTRETIPSIQHGAPSWLLSEQSYGDGDDAMSRYPPVPSLTKRRRSSESPTLKRARH